MDYIEKNASKQKLGIFISIVIIADSACYHKMTSFHYHKVSINQIFVGVHTELTVSSVHCCES